MTNLSVDLYLNRQSKTWPACYCCCCSQSFSIWSSISELPSLVTGIHLQEDDLKLWFRYSLNCLVLCQVFVFYLPSLMSLSCFSIAICCFIWLFSKDSVARVWRSEATLTDKSASTACKNDVARCFILCYMDVHLAML